MHWTSAGCWPDETQMMVMQSIASVTGVSVLQDGAPPSSGEATPMETEHKDAAAAPSAAPAAAPQEVEEVIKKKRTRKSNINFTSQTAGMQTEQLTVRLLCHYCHVGPARLSCMALFAMAH